jgi:3-methyladenine DNA glycosylase AlkD
MKDVRSAIMNANEIVEKLRTLGADGYKKVLLNHGAKEPCFGVKIEELKKIQKKVKRDYQLALDLYATGIYDAMYLAGLIADDEKMTKKDLRKWLKEAKSPPIAEYTVASVAAGSKHGHELALEWIESDDEDEAATGWSTLCGLVATKDDAELDLAELKHLLDRVEATIHKEPNRVRYMMNSFVISLGSYVRDLTKLALAAGKKIGPVTVDMGNTACKVPSAVEYIQKVQKRGAIGKKRATAKC